MSYSKRIAEHTLRRYLQAFPVIGLTGPRQSGKSTLLQHTLTNYRYVSFDDPKNVLNFSDDPQGFLNYYSSQIIFDEVQYVPEIFNYIKMKVDKDRHNYGNYVLTGSSQFKFMQHASESLAGRIGLMSLLPFQYSEMPAASVSESIFRGSYPELVLRHYREAELWFGAYLETYLNKDLRTIANIGDLRDFRRFLQLLAAQVSQLLDMSSLARDVGVSVPTIKRWLSVLEASYIIFLLPPFYENYGKRIIKSPKIYFYDNGIVSYFTGIMTYEHYNNGAMAGSLFENYVVSEIVKKELHSGSQAEFYYLRTQDKAEIDLIVDRKSNRDFIEIKKSATFQPRMVQSLTKYAREKDNKFLLYNGERDQHRNVSLLPYWEYLRVEE